MIRFAHASPDGRRVVYEALGHLWIKDAAGGAPRRLTRAGRRVRALSRHGRATGGRSSTSAGTTQRPGGSRWSGQRRHRPQRHARARPLSRAGLLARRPDRSPIARPATAILTTPLWGRDPGIYVVPRARRNAQAGRPRTARCRSSARPTTACSSSANERRGQALAALDRAQRRQGDHPPHLRRMRAEFAISPDEQFVAWTERYQAYVMPFVRCRPVDRHRRPTARRCRRRGSAPTPATGCIGRATAAASTGRRGPTSTAATSRPPPAFARRQGAGAAPRRSRSASPPTPRRPTGMLALTGARIVTMRGDEVIENGTVLIDGNRIAAVGPTAAVSYPGRHADHRRQPARPSSPA